MAWGYTGEAISCTFDGTAFTNDDFSGANADATYLVKLDATNSAASSGAPIPVVEKATADGDLIYGVAVGIDGDGAMRNNVAGQRRVRVVRNGIVNVTKDSTAPATTDVGSAVTGAGGGAGEVVDLSTDKGDGRGTIVGITGTTTADKLVVDLDVDPIATA